MEKLTLTQLQNKYPLETFFALPAIDQVDVEQTCTDIVFGEFGGYDGLKNAIEFLNEVDASGVPERVPQIRAAMALMVDMLEVEPCAN